MDNDIKVNEIKFSSREISELLKDELEILGGVDQHFSYSIEKEYPKSRRNMAAFMWRKVWSWLLLSFLVVGMVLAVMIRFVRHTDESISIDIATSVEVNLGNLFEKVNELDAKIQEADAERRKVVDQRNAKLMEIENRRAGNLKKLDETSKQAVAGIHAETKNRRKIRKMEKLAMEEAAAREKEIESSYKNDLLELDSFNSLIAEYDREINELIRQRDEFDRDKVEESEKQKAALDSSRILFEREKQRLIEEYEMKIEEIQMTARENLQENYGRELRKLREEKKMLLAERKAFFAGTDLFLENLCVSGEKKCDGVVLNYAPTQNGGIYIATGSRKTVDSAVHYGLVTDCRILRGEKIVGTARVHRNMDGYYLLDVMLADPMNPVTAADRIFFR